MGESATWLLGLRESAVAYQSVRLPPDDGKARYALALHCLHYLRRLHGGASWSDPPA